MNRLALALLLLAAAASCADAAKVLMVIKTPSIGASESSRKSQFEAWGHTVTTIHDQESQANFNTAMAAVDVVYIPVTVDHYDITNKAKLTTKGVVCEERYLDVEMGFSTGVGWDNSYSQTEILNNTHEVTSGLSTGYVTIVSSSQPLALMNDTVASGMTILSKQNLAAGKMLGVIETGGALAGGGTAAGRRVRLPWGSDSFNWSALNSNGLLIAQNAISWASGSGDLLLHWKLDETSGTTAADDSGNGNNGSTSGTTSWTSARRNGGIDVNTSSKVQVSDLLGQPTSFTVAAWVDTDSIGSNGGVAVSIGDHVALVMDEPYWGGGKPTIVFNYSGSYFEYLAGAESAVGAGWRHYAATFDTASNSLKLYVDGELVASKTTTREIDWASSFGTTTTAGGNSYPIGGYEFDGRVDDVRIYGSALSDAEIAEVYGLIAHWKLDESSGATAVDSSLGGNDATRTGTSAWTTGQDGGAHEFDYTDGEEYFQAPSNDPLDDAQEGDYTVMAYYRPGAVPSGSGGDIAHSILVKSGYHLGLLYDNSGNFYIDHWLTGDIRARAASVDSYGVGEWRHVAGVVSRTEGTVTLYVDGQEVGSTSFTPDTGSRDYGTTPWRIAVGAPGGSYRAVGTIDDVRIYNRALSDEEVAEFYIGLIAHWKLDESSGSTAVDSSTTANDGTYTNGVTVGQAGPFPGVGAVAPSFDGDDDYVAIPNESLYDITSAITVAAWFKIDQYDHHFQTIVAKGDSAWRISRDASTDFLHFACSGLTNSSLYGDIPVNDGAWHHVVGVYDGSKISLYVDGQLDVENSSTGTIATNNYPVAIGMNPQVSYRNWEGGIFDVRVYNYGFTAEEVAELYGLVGWWKLDESSGTTAADSSGMGRHGTYLGSPTLGAAGPVGGGLAATFDGDDDVVMLPTISDEFPNGVALSGWMKPTAINNFAKIIQLSVGTSREIDLGRSGTSNSLRGVADNYSALEYSGGIHNGVWRHYAMSIDGTGVMRLYRNGSVVAEGTRVPAQAAERNTNWIGGSNWGVDELFEGQLSDVRLYNRPISDEEARTLYLGEEVVGPRIVKWVETANP